MRVLRRSVLLFVLVALTMSLFPLAAQAAPYMTPEEIARMQPVWDAGAEDAIYGVPNGGLDDLEDYTLTVEQVNVLDWLTTMQELGDNPNFGGMHEGETNTWNIIETDNTAEACRDWSHYARMTGDLDRYSDNIQAAWTYQYNYPAYSEEGGGNPNYYRCHNAGWALMAAMEYTEAYGMDPDVITYADSCANYLQQYPLPPSNTLNSYSASFGAGCLYTYSEWRGTDPSWSSSAQDWAVQIRAYAESNPNLFGSRTWAMSGGTLMWGIVTALYLDNPDDGQDWIPQYSDMLPTYSGGANWNNSHTVWNGFAWHRIHQVMQDQESLDNALFVMDYLFDQMYLDDDSGVPGTENTYTDDQSWTTAYTVWYELEQLFSYYDTPWDVAAMEIVSPTPDDVIQLGDVIDVTVRVANAGLEPIGPGTQIATLILEDQVGPISMVEVELGYGEEIEVTLPSPWVPGELGDNTLTATMVTDNDNNPDNDDASTVINVRSNYSIVGSVLDEDNGSGVYARISTTPVAPGGTPAVTESDPNTGEYTLYVLPGTYSLTMLPKEAPYPPRTEVITIGGDDLITQRDYLLPRAANMYVVNAPLPLAITGYQRMKQLFGPQFDPCVWPVSELGMPEGELTYVGMNTVFWSHLVPEGPLFSAEQYDALNDFLETDGNLLIIGGTGLGNVLNFEERLRLGVAPGQLDMPHRIVASNPGDALLGDSLFLQLPQNLNVVDAINPFHPNATRLGYYANTTRAAGQRVVWPEGAVSITMGFPLEASHPDRGYFAGGTAADWLVQQQEFAAQHGAEVAGDAGTMAALPGEWGLNAWPNPFNPVLHVTVQAPTSEPATLALYDLLGRRVARWTLDGGVGQRAVSWHDPGAASGVYLLRLEAGSDVLTRRVTLLK